MINTTEEIIEFLDASPEEWDYLKENNPESYDFVLNVIAESILYASEDQELLSRIENSGENVINIFEEWTIKAIKYLNRNTQTIH